MLCAEKATTASAGPGGDPMTSTRPSAAGNRPSAAARSSEARSDHGRDRSPHVLDLAEADAFHKVTGPDQQVA